MNYKYINKKIINYKLNNKESKTKQNNEPCGNVTELFGFL